MLRAILSRLESALIVLPVLLAVALLFAGAQAEFDTWGNLIALVLLAIIACYIRIWGQPD